MRVRGAIVVLACATAACGKPPELKQTPETRPAASGTDAQAEPGAVQDAFAPLPSPYPPPATEAERAVFAGSPEEPEPGERLEEAHYVHSNELHHELFFPYVRGLGGGYMGVGSDQNYTIAAAARSEWVWLVDYDSVVNRMHRVVAALVAGADDASVYMDLWSKERSEDAIGIIRAAYEGDPEEEDLVRIYREYRAMTYGYNERVSARARSGRCAFWLADAGSYAYVRALFAAGRVRSLRGDLRVGTTVAGIGKAAKELGTKVRVVYLSDAETFFHYTPGFKDSVGALPVDERSVFLRTAAGNVFGKERADYQWHYNVHLGTHFAALLRSETFDKVWSALKQGQATGVEGVSVTGWDDPQDAFAKLETAVEEVVIADPECGPVPESMACVPAGWFVRGALDSDPNRRPEAKVWVSTFWIDIMEITNALFNECIRARVCSEHEHYKGFMGPEQPAVGITWYNASAYCTWAGKRLPTEAEWEKAARGPDGERFPWGNDPATCETAHFRGCTPPTTLQVGSLPAGRYGIFDMAGNGYEWVQDWYAPCYDGCEKACGTACAGPDPGGPCGGKGDTCPGFLKLKVLKGGSWFWPAAQVEASWRRPYKPESGEHRLSVRCAMTPPAGGS